MTLPNAAELDVLLADDEEGPREQLAAALQQVRPGARIRRAVNGTDAWDQYLERTPGLCLLDIRMPGLTGIDVARRIGARTPVVLVTAHGDHALEAFEAGAVDYVLKPVVAERLAQALDRVERRWAAPDSDAAAGAPVAAPVDAPRLAALLDQLALGLRRPAAPAVLQAAVGREVKLIRVDEVIFFESDARYTRVVTADGDALIRTPLKDLLAQLDEREFWQIHRSVIVNHRHIASAVRIDEGQMQLTLRGRDDRLPVSRHFQALFKGQ